MAGGHMPESRGFWAGVGDGVIGLLPVYNEAKRLEPDGIREVISGNLCRCTGYQQIVEAVQVPLDEAFTFANDAE